MNEIEFFFTAQILLAELTLSLNICVISSRVQSRKEIQNFASNINPSRPNPERREEINLNFYFHPSLWCLRRFH